MENKSDIAFFVTLVRHATLAAAAQELGVTPPAVSRRLAAIEERLGVRLFNRTTRQRSLTAEGELYLEEGQRILNDVEQLEQELSASMDTPKGKLRVNAGIGFGRRHIGPAVAEFTKLYPEVEVILSITDAPLDLAADGIDVCIRLGLGSDTSLLARKLATNSRYLVASPEYLAQHPAPEKPRDLLKHQCIVIREFLTAYNTWQLVSGSTQKALKVNGALSTNHGEVALQWALSGHGIVLRSEWDVMPYLRSGELVQVLPEWTGVGADFYAVYLQRHYLSAKVRAFIDFMAERFAERRRTDTPW